MVVCRAMEYVSILQLRKKGRSKPKRVAFLLPKISMDLNVEVNSLESYMIIIALSIWPSMIHKHVKISNSK